MIAKRITQTTFMLRALCWFCSPTIVIALVAGAMLLVSSATQLPAAAQASALENGPPPPPPEEGPSAPPAKSEPTRTAATSDPTTTAEPTAPVWDPLHAHKSIEVGMFYLKKGNYDAAIDRFQDAARMQPGLAAPFLLLGEAYEKKNDSVAALTSYRKYLDLYRTAPNREKIQKRIEKLESQTAHEGTRRGSG